MTRKQSRYDSWKERYSFNKCELNNEEYGTYLSSYLRSQKKPLVLNLNGSWGTGKTHFLKQMYSDLRFKHGYPVIYIDAWKSDFSNDPLLVLISEFIEQFQSLSYVIDAASKEEEMLKVVAKFSKRLWNMSAIGVGTYLSGKMDNGAIVEAAKTLTFSDADAVQIGRNLTDNYKAQLSAIEDTKEVLGHYLEYFNEDKRKVFVLVDELDRCRPTYAIEMLETIKHFFSLDNYIFVVATDTNQLSHSIKAIYGSKFDGTEYLSRFFNRSAALPEPDKGLFAKLLVNDSLLVEIDVKMVSDLEYSVEFLAKLLHEVSTMYDLSLRRMEQVFRKLESCILYELDTENRYFDIRLLIQLIAEYDSAEFHICYQARKGFNGKHYTLPKSFKHKLDVGTDDILDITTNLRQKEIKKIEPNNPEYLVQLRQNYKFSWDFANSFNDIPQSKTIMISECYRVLNQEKQSFQTRNGYNVSGREELYGALLFDRFDHFNRLYQLGKGNEQAWTRNDYFKAVELSSTITNE